MKGDGKTDNRSKGRLYEGLAEEFLAGGPVVAVECAPAGEALPAGTLLSCSVVLEEKPPLAFLFPALSGAA